MRRNDSSRTVPTNISNINSINTTSNTSNIRMPDHTTLHHSLAEAAAAVARCRSLRMAMPVEVDTILAEAAGEVATRRLRLRTTAVMATEVATCHLLQQEVAATELRLLLSLRSRLLIRTVLLLRSGAAHSNHRTALPTGTRTRRHSSHNMVPEAISSRSTALAAISSRSTVPEAISNRNMVPEAISSRNMVPEAIKLHRSLSTSNNKEATINREATIAEAIEEAAAIMAIANMRQHHRTTAVHHHGQHRRRHHVPQYTTKQRTLCTTIYVCV